MSVHNNVNQNLWGSMNIDHYIGCHVTKKNINNCDAQNWDPFSLHVRMHVVWSSYAFVRLPVADDKVCDVHCLTVFDSR